MASCRIQSGKGHGGLYKAMEALRKRNAKRRKREQIKFIDLRFEGRESCRMGRVMLGKGHGGLYKAPTEEERRK